MAWVWTAMVAVALIFGIFNNALDAVSRAALEGASEGVRLCIAIGGMVCLWSGVMEIMNQAGLSERLARLFRPALKKLFPTAARNGAALEALSANVSANLLGLGNAATPAGIRAAGLIAAGSGYATDDLCMLVVLNTASVQLIPSTLAGIRAGAGAASPFDILPAVWITSLASVLAGIAAAKLMSKFWRK